MPDQPRRALQLALVPGLIAAGMGSGEANLWSALAMTAIRALRVAEWRVRRSGAHLSRDREGRPRQPEEDDFTNELFHEIDRMRRVALGSGLQDVEFHTQVPVDQRTDRDARGAAPPEGGPDRRGRAQRRMDLRISRRFGRGRCLDIAVEAKLLRRPGDVRSRYLGEEGIGRFMGLDSPYTRERLAFMLAYVLTDDRPAWRRRLSDAVLAGVVEGATLRPADEVPPSFELHTVVPRTALRLPPISVLHGVMDFRPDRLGAGARS